MLKASPSSSAPGVWIGAAGMSLFCMLRMRPAFTASKKDLRSCFGTCIGADMLETKHVAIPQVHWLRSKTWDTSQAAGPCLSQGNIKILE